MGYEFTYHTTLDHGPVCIELDITCEYNPATEANGSSVDYLDFDCDINDKLSLGILWPRFREWINSFRSRWEKEGEEEARKQGLNKYDRHPATYVTRRAVGCGYGR